MDEKSFWIRLEFRVSGELGGQRDRHCRSFWCDGFVPYEFLLDGPRPRITGTAWIVQNQESWDSWDFTLLLPRPFRSREDIDWESLLPPENVTRWLTFHEGREYLEIEPAAAVPDPD